MAPKGRYSEDPSSNGSVEDFISQGSATSGYSVAQSVLAGYDGPASGHGNSNAPGPNELGSQSGPGSSLQPSLGTAVPQGLYLSGGERRLVSVSKSSLYVFGVIQLHVLPFLKLYPSPEYLLFTSILLKRWHAIHHRVCHGDNRSQAYLLR